MLKIHINCHYNYNIGRYSDCDGKFKCFCEQDAKVESTHQQSENTTSK